jgi:hypothetical protein
MLDRLEQLLEDKLAIFDREQSHVERAMDRSFVDQKDACEVLRSMRVEFTKNVMCNQISAGVTSGANTIFTADSNEWRVYEGMFDDFHYDIGHGKGLGEGRVDSAQLTTGFRSGNLQATAAGDRQTSVGSATRTFEQPRNRRGGF